MRTVDLARAAGVSTQQIRNYEDAGVLPPVPRTGSGYRAFDERHLGAALTYRALAAGHGPEAARSIMHAVLAGEVARALELVDAGHALLHSERAALRATATALEGLVPASPPVDGGSLTVGELAARLGVRPSTLRVWEAAGLLAPGRERSTGYRRYGPDEIRDARMIRMLRQGHYPLPQIAPILDGLRRTGSSDALREAVAHRQAALTQRSAAMLRAAARLSDFMDGGPAA